MAALLYNRNHSNHPIVLHRENSTQANISGCFFFKSKVVSTMFYEIWRDDCARGNIGGWFITTHTREGHECLNQIFSNCPIDQPTDWHCFSATSGKNSSEVSVIRWEYFERKKRFQYSVVTNRWEQSVFFIGETCMKLQVSPISPISCYLGQ